VRAIVWVSAIATVACALGQPAAAGGTHFGMKPIVIAGSTNVNATAINNKRTIVGFYYTGDVVNGFILGGGVPITLPPTYANCLNPCVAFPTAINAAGDVVGQTFFGESYAFLWRNGSYVGVGGFDLGLGGGYVAGPGLNNKGQEFYNYYIGSGFYAPYFGTPGAMMPIAPPGSFPEIASINNRGAVAGTFAPFAPSIFVERNGKFVTILPPGAVASQGGFINDLGAVAGSYQDAASAWHGFVYHARKYTSFEMPTDAASITVQAINGKGRVVGVYTSGKKGVQRIFLYNGNTVSAFGKYAAGDQLRLAINDAGVMLVSDYAAGVYRSWRVLCGGAGC
jgi:probable HAF family extracellular repeat protein